MRIRVASRPVEDRGRERVLGLRVGRRGLVRVELLELRAAAAPDGFDEVGVGVADEVRERVGLPVLLANEQQRHERGAQRCCRRELQAGGIDERREPLAGGAVADLVVVLGEDDEALTGPSEVCGLAT